MRLVHLTDPHLSSLAQWSFLTVHGKRRSGYLSWTYRRQKVYRREVLERLHAAIQAESADHLILSGDLVQIGLEHEILEARSWLNDLSSTAQIFFVPGNHDVYAKDSWSAIRRHWGFVLPPPAQDRPDTSTAAYPFVRDIGTVRLIGASSACVTPVFSSRGALGQEQIVRLSALLREARETGMMPCVAIHHPPLPHMSPWTKALKEIRTTKELIAEHQPALVWCGHQHQNIEASLGQARIYCTASASSSKNASFRIFDIEPAKLDGRRMWDIRMQLKGIDPNGSGFVLTDEKRWRFTA